MEETGKRMPRRYGMGGDGKMGRTWGGKLPEEFGTKERLLFLADNDLALYGRLTVDTLNAVRESGFRYEGGNLLSLRELAERGMRNRGKYPEVYRLSLGEAKSRGELERFYASHHRDSCCRLAMDSAVDQNFREGALKPGCLDHILKEDGFERVEWVLAHTIRQKRDDPGISQGNREWADSFHVPRNDPIGGSMWLASVMHCPAEAVEMAASMVREEHSRQCSRQKENRAQHKPSIRKQLAAGVPATESQGIERKVAEHEVR